MDVDAAVHAVLPWANFIFYGGFLVLLVIHLKHGGSSNKLIPFTDEVGGWSNGNFKLLRWIIGLVAASGVCGASVAWILIEKKHFATDVEDRAFLANMEGEPYDNANASLTPETELAIEAIIGAHSASELRVASPVRASCSHPRLVSAPGTAS